jgi:hypothetical protein
MKSLKESTMERILYMDLCARLPYAVKFIDLIVGDFLELDPFTMTYDTETIGLAVAVREKANKNFQAVLHPMEDCTKEITQNGETFIPAIKIFQMDEPIYTYSITELQLGDNLGSEYIEFDITECLDDKTAQIIKNTAAINPIHRLELRIGKPSRLEHWQRQALLEMHFDVNNLIPKGYATDVNELDKSPYA